ncbi:hypothetical protein [Kineococcus sp. NPDC059986]|uniref:hypothetical protein n=1 Tax=Kineococcus sp. NPDC059986 TaxID=3155538 RepID=UPI003450D0B0
MEGVCEYEPATLRPSGIAAGQLSVLAVRADARHSGVGGSAVDARLQLLRAGAAQLQAGEVVVAAVVHEQNQEMARLLSRRAFRPHGTVGDDGYAVWAATLTTS